MIRISKSIPIYILLSIVINSVTSDDQKQLDDNRLKQLDIGKKCSNDDFYYFENLNSDLAVYIPKNNLLINEVKVGPDAKNVYGTESNIWKADNNFETSDRVEINGVCDWKPTKLTIIHLINGDFKRFSIPEPNKPWAENKDTENFGGNLLTEHRPREIELHIMNSPTTNDITKYYPYELVHKVGTEYKVVGYHYIFKNETICTRIDHKGFNVWTKDPQKTADAYPQRIYFNTYPKRMTICIYFNEGSVYEYALEKNEWKMTNSSLAGPKELDINTMENTVDFGFYNNDKIKGCVYIANKWRSFKSVKQFNEILWEAKDPSLHADYVMITDMGTKDELITIHFNNGSIFQCKAIEPVTKGGKRKGISNKVKYTIIGVSIFAFVLVASGLVFWFLKKNPLEGN